MVKIMDSRGWDKQYRESQCYNIRSNNYEKIYLITKINEPFTCFICWADITSKPKNCIFMLFYICDQNDKFGEYIIHNNATSFLDCRGEDHFVLTIFFKRITKVKKQVWEGVLINIHKKNADLSNVELNWFFNCII